MKLSNAWNLFDYKFCQSLHVMDKLKKDLNLPQFTSQIWRILKFIINKNILCVSLIRFIN